MSSKLIKIISAEYQRDHIIKVKFSDGLEKAINFHSFIKNNSNPNIQAYLNLEKFKSFQVKEGDLMWGDYDLLFPITDLYEGKISA